MDEPQPPAFEAGAIVTRMGDAGHGFSEWKVAVQIRQPTADFDAVHTIRLVAKNPPTVSEILLLFEARPQDFTFWDFLPNRNKQPSGGGG